MVVSAPHPPFFVSGIDPQASIDTPDILFRTKWTSVLVKKEAAWDVCASPLELFSREVIAFEQKLLLPSTQRESCPLQREMIYNSFPLSLSLSRACSHRNSVRLHVCEDGENRNVMCARVGDLYLYEHQIKRLDWKGSQGEEGRARGNLEKRKKKEKGATAN